MPSDTAELYEAVAAWLLAPPRAEDCISWSEANWRTAKHAVLVHGIAPLLGARHEATMEFAFAPAWFGDYLIEQSLLNRARIARLRQESGAIFEAARAAGIDVAPLKGSALFTLEGFPINERPMTDIDVLVRNYDIAAFEAILVRHDYVLTEESPRHREFTCQRFSTNVVSSEGEHPDNPIKVEVHTWAGQLLLSSERIDITRALWEARTAPRAIVLHLAVHAGSSAAKRRLRLVQLRDLALLAPSLNPQDWDWLRSETSRADAGTLVYSALNLATRFTHLVPRTTSSLSVSGSQQDVGIPSRPTDEPGSLSVAHGALYAALRKQCAPDLLHLLDSAPLHAFMHLSDPLTREWELLWFAPGLPRLWLRAKQALPLHRLAMDSVRLRERYKLPLEASPARAYAMHAARAAVWPAILLSRFLRGSQ